jgi:predicted phosphodiesterase
MKVRMALFSDIHGNRFALDAVLDDARAYGADSYWVLGDLAAIGPEPVAVLERLAGLENATIIRGNTDRYVVTGEVPPPSLEDAQANPDLVGLFARVAASFAWTRGFVTAAGWFDWLERLPLEVRLTLPDGSRLLGIHASPGLDDGEGIHPGRSPSEMAQLLTGCGAEIVCAGHTHQPLHRLVGGVRVINLGSVSNPSAPDLRASYVMLHASDAGTRVEHRRVAYDHAAFIESVRRTRHPEAEFILDFQRGRKVGRSPHPDQSFFALA